LFHADATVYAAPRCGTVGWVVPFLCLGLLIRRWLAFPKSREQKVESRNWCGAGILPRYSVPGALMMAGIFFRAGRPWMVSRFYAALAYALANPDEIEESLREEDEMAKQLSPDHNLA